MQVNAIEFQTSNVCNAKCRICPHSKLFKEKIELTNEAIDNIIKYAVKHKVKLLLPYCNNEPFADKRMISILKKIKLNNIDVELSTNLSYLNKEIIDVLFKEKLIKDFRISFFSSFEKKYENLMVGLNYSENIEKLKYIHNNHNSSNVTVCMVMYKGFDVEKEKANFKKIIPNITLHFFGYLDRAGEMKNKNNLLRQQILDDVNLYMSRCQLGRLNNRLNIYANGNCIICSQDWTEKTVYGNINIDDIEEILISNERIQKLKYINGNEKLPKNFICRQCKLAYLKVGCDEKLNFCGDQYMNEVGIKEGNANEHKF